MSPSWTADEFRRVRIALVAASALLWTAWMGAPGGPTTLAHLADRVLAAAQFAGAIHFGLLFSLTAERGSTALRAAGALILVTMIFLVGAGLAFLSTKPFDGRGQFVAALSSIVALHALQLWRLAGVPFPRVHPITYSNPAPDHGAGRNAAR